MIQNIIDTERAYFAGLFDGEGSVGIKKTKCNNYIGYSLRVLIGITYKPVLLKMQKFFGGNLYITHMEVLKNSTHSKKLKNYTNANPDKWKQMYMYDLSSERALYFLKIIEPFCNEKKQQVSLGIRYEQGKRHDYIRSKRETERSEFFYQELKKLKKEQPTENEIEDKNDFVDQQQDLFSFVEEI